MKKVMLIATLIFLSLAARAQTWSEWFEQKKTQIKYLSEQIAALKAYGDVAWNGYVMAKEGLRTIGAIKDGDRLQHRDYFASLARVNPSVKAYWKVAAIASLQEKIVRLCGQQTNAVNKSTFFTAEEKTYVNSVLSTVLTDCNDLLAKRSIPASNGTAEMKDDERLNEIDRIYVDTQNAYAFLRNFGAQTDAVQAARRQEAAGIKTSRSLLNIQ